MARRVIWNGTVTRAQYRVVLFDGTEDEWPSIAVERMHYDAMGEPYYRAVDDDPSRCLQVLGHVLADMVHPERMR